MPPLRWCTTCVAAYADAYVSHVSDYTRRVQIPGAVSLNRQNFEHEVIKEEHIANSYDRIAIFMANPHLVVAEFGAACGVNPEEMHRIITDSPEEYAKICKLLDAELTIVTPRDVEIWADGTDDDDEDVKKIKGIVESIARRAPEIFAAALRDEALEEALARSLVDH